MAPKSILTKDEILASGVNLTKRDGMDALNARSLAVELGISTTPVLQNFGSMENLRREVKIQLLSELEDHRIQLLEKFSPRLWMARLGAYVLYGWKYPQGYRVLRDWFWSEDSPGSWEALLEDVRLDPWLREAPLEYSAQKAFRLNVYASGFAEMAARGMLYRPTEEGILGDLEEALMLLMKGEPHDFPALA